MAMKTALNRFKPKKQMFSKRAFSSSLATFQVQVRQKAPDFHLPAVLNKEFTKISLNDYKSKW